MCLGSFYEDQKTWWSNFTSGKHWKAKDVETQKIGAKAEDRTCEKGTRILGVPEPVIEDRGRGGEETDMQLGEEWGSKGSSTTRRRRVLGHLVSAAAKKVTAGGKMYLKKMAARLLLTFTHKIVKQLPCFNKRNKEAIKHVFKTMSQNFIEKNIPTEVIIN